MNRQEADKQDGRCVIPNGRGGVKRCPCRIKNPDFVPGNGQSATLAVSCEGCKYQPYRQAHSTIPFSAMDYVNEDGDVTPYEPVSPAGYLQGDEISKEFIAFVKERNPKLVPLAELLVQECSRSEAARELGLPTSTVGSRAKKLEELVREFCAD